MESRKRYHLLIVASALMWGSSFPLIKVTLDYVNPYFLTAVRMLIAGAIGLVFVMAFSRTAIFKEKTVWILAGFNALGYSLQHIGMQYTLASESALLINVNVIFVAILAAYILGEKMTSWKALALALGVGGILILTSKGDLSFFASEELLGQSILIASGFSWAVFIVLMKRLLDTHEIVDVSMAVVAETALILSPLVVFYPSTGIALEGWAGIIYLGVVCTTLALFVYLVGPRRVGATTSSILLSAEVLFAIILSILFLEEQITAPLLLGGLLVLLAIILASWNRETTPR
ncbi:MAG: DMT family transporter [Candidatus Thermoplasmatota archaeon]|nr:DMT family transporter [Candidatus Thermoplasmatota archaeon]